MVGITGGNGKRPSGLTGIEATLRPLRALEATYRAFDAAEVELRKVIGVPLCVPSCGKCCEVTTPMAWDVEAQFAVSALMSQPEKMQQVLSACEGWLLDRSPVLRMYGMKGAVSRETWERLGPEIDHLLMRSPCPMLLEDKRCLLHDARLLVCRAYGVTRMAVRWCPRPLGKHESDETRAHIGPFTPLGNKLRRMVAEVMKGAAVVGWTNTRFLPTSLYAIVRPDKLNAYMDDGKIASAKLVRMIYNTNILFQDQLSLVWARERAASPTKAPVQTEKTEGGTNV